MGLRYVLPFLGIFFKFWKEKQKKIKVLDIEEIILIYNIYLFLIPGVLK
ncbi:hypothetical protein T190115A13A_60098 [Tenacibaculum sp. 190524A02b]|uniref:Uncharacterized protein n=1 Tax=Tenacibaculum vairaonense TaxID=3137860 RepID=A0ABM9PQQ2_9FLAO